MASTVTLQFNSPIPDQEYLILRGDLNPGNDLSEIFVVVRNAPGLTTLDTSSSQQRENYRLAFNADYNLTNIYTVTLLLSNQLSIEHPNSGFFDFFKIINTTVGIEVVSIVNSADKSPINITDVSFLPATDICKDINVVVTTDNLATKILSPIIVDPNADNPFNFDWVRGAAIAIRVETFAGEQTSQIVQLPMTLSVDNTTIQVLNAPSGATITALVTNVDLLTLTYSVDNLTYQASNTFPSIVQGNYTMYILDQFGCKIQVPFVVDDFNDSGIGVLTPVADLPEKSNSIRYLKKVDFALELKNDENTLACQSPFVHTNKSEIQLFETNDNPVTQFRSNYETLIATVKDNEGNTTFPIITKKTNNIALKDSRDAIKYDLLNGQTGYYFTTGNVYDFDTGLPTGTYALNGALPNWGVKGNFVFVNLGWFKIVDVIFDESKSAEVIVIDSIYTDIDISEIIGTIYNNEEHDFYEFTVNTSIHQDKNIQVTLDETSTNPNYPDVQFISEIISVREEHPNTLKIDYYSDENTAILFSTGIKHRIRIPLIYSVGVALEESETDTTDDSAYLIEANVHEADEFHFSWQTKEMMRKLVQAINHPIVFLDDVGYVKNGEVELNPVPLTNVYKPVAVMIKQSNVYTTTPKKAVVITELDFPLLITDGENFIKYE